MRRFLRNVVIIIILLFLLFFSSLDALEYTEVIAQKMKMEGILQVQVEKVLTKMLGEGMFSVVINIEPEVEKSTTETESWATQKSAGSDSAMSEIDKKTKLPTSNEFLPGIPLKKNLMDDDREKAKKEKEQEAQSLGMKKSVEIVSKLPKSFIKKITAILVLDRRIEEETVDSVKAVVTQMLNMDNKRGDKLIIRQEKFVPPAKWWSFVTKPQFYLMLVAVILGLFILWYLFRLLRRLLAGISDVFKQSKEAEVAGAAQAAGYGMGEGEIEDTLSEEEVEIVEKPRDEDLEQKVIEEVKEMELEPFKYLQEKDLKYFMYLIKDLSPEKIAAVLGYLDPGKSAKVLESLPDELQVKVAVCMVRVQETSEDLIVALNEEVKERLDNVVGGMDKFVEVLNMLDTEAREGIMRLLEKNNPDMVNKIKERVFTFEQIVDIDTQALRIVLGEINTGELAVALRKASEELKSKVMSNLSEGGVALLREEMEFGKPVTDARIAEEQAKIIGVIKRLEEEGKIALGGTKNKKILEMEEYEKNKKVTIGELKKKDEKEDTKSGEGNNEKAFEFYNTGIESYNAGKIDEAINSFEESLKYNQDIWQTYQYLGNCYYSKGLENEAIDAYESALKLNPENTELSEWLKEHTKTS